MGSLSLPPSHSLSLSLSLSLSQQDDCRAERDNNRTTKQGRGIKTPLSPYSCMSNKQQQIRIILSIERITTLLRRLRGRACLSVFAFGVRMHQRRAHIKYFVTEFKTVFYVFVNPMHASALFCDCSCFSKRRYQFNNSC